MPTYTVTVEEPVMHRPFHGHPSVLMKRRTHTFKADDDFAAIERVGASMHSLWRRHRGVDYAARFVALAESTGRTVLLA